jgi:hypothetical protein
VSGLWLGGLGPAVHASGQVLLPAGALVPSPTGPVLVDAEAVRQAAARVLQGLDAGRARVRLLLPDGLARVVLLDAPDHVAADEFARFRLGPGLPFAASEAAFGTLRLPRGNAVLAAALRCATVAAFEALVRGLGVEPAGVTLSSLAALAPLAPGVLLPNGVAILLGDTTVSYAGLRAGRLCVVRQRLLDGVPDAAQLIAEAQRTAALAGLAPGAALALAGRGARAAQHSLQSAGHEVSLLDLGLRGAPEAAQDWAWLKGLAA